VLCAALYGWFMHSGTTQSVVKAPSVPVAASIVRSGNLDVYLNQIGTVTPFATVTIKSRIAGQIMKIDFKEGQLVKAGDLLVNIDPSPYEAQLAQFEGQLSISPIAGSYRR
jgi:multidrug efflux system membrane fusion protein